MPVAAGNKSRVSDDRVEIDTIVGDVAGKRAIVLDDEIANGGTVAKLLERLQEYGAREAAVVCTHGLFTGRAVERFRSATAVTEWVTTNTVPLRADVDLPNLTVLSVAPLLGEAIRRVHLGESVSSLFARPDWAQQPG